MMNSMASSSIFNKVKQEKEAIFRLLFLNKR